MSIPTIFTDSIESRLIQLHQYQLSTNFLCQYTFKNNRKNLGHKTKANLHRSLTFCVICTVSSYNGNYYFPLIDGKYHIEKSSML